MFTDRRASDSTHHAEASAQAIQSSRRAFVASIAAASIAPTVASGALAKSAATEMSPFPVFASDSERFEHHMKEAARALFAVTAESQGGATDGRWTVCFSGSFDARTNQHGYGWNLVMTNAAGDSNSTVRDAKWFQMHGPAIG